MQIAVCDDEYAHINITEDFLDRIKQNCSSLSWDVFHSGEELTEYYRKNTGNYDVILLDMEMKGLNGIDTANIIRSFDEHVIIIFVTSHVKYMQKSFECSPFRFLVKPVTLEDLKKVLNEAETKLEKQRKTFVFSENRIKTRLFCDDILYFESQSHWLIIHTKNKNHKILKTFIELEGQIDMDTFTRVHKSFIVNLGHIKEIGNTDIGLYNCCEQIPLSRRYKKSVGDKFLNFRERRYLI